MWGKLNMLLVGPAGLMIYAAFIVVAIIWAVYGH